MVTNNSLNQASEIFIIGPIGTAADSTTLLTVRKDQASNTQAKILNNTNAGSAFWSLEQKFSTSSQRSSAGFGILSDAASPANIAGFAVLQSNISGSAEPGLGVAIHGSQSTDLVKITIGATAVTQAIWNSLGGQYRGNNTNTAPPAGYIGEVISATATTGALTNNTVANVTSISLTAGVWDVSAINTFNTSGTVAGTTQWATAISTANNNLTGVGENGSTTDGGKIPVSGVNGVSCWGGPTRVTLSATTTHFLNCRGFAGTTFTDVTCTGIIRAVRVG